MAPRTLLPTKDGTTIPPCSASSTTVPVDGRRPEAFVAGDRELTSAEDCFESVAGRANVSRWRSAAGIMALSLDSGFALAGVLGGVGTALVVAASATSSVSPK